MDGTDLAKRGCNVQRRGSGDRRWSGGDTGL